jgi:FixJ family two-component response regulator
MEEDGARVDVVLTDVVMPRMSGPELAARLKQTQPEVPVVFMSGYPEQMVLRGQALEPGATLVEKPFTARTLLDTLAVALEQGS